MQSKPNIILILADDMGYGDFGLFNNGLSKTPRLDGMVSEGVCLTQHYSASCVCAPARAGLLTGRYPHRTGAISLMSFRGLDRLALREVTIADVLSNAGYKTGIIGKWHLGEGDIRYSPRRRGFSEAVTFPHGGSDYYNWRLDYNGSRRKTDGRYLTDVITEESVEFIKRNRSNPFFLYVAYNAPHRPLQAPEEEVKPFAETGRFNDAVSTIYGMIHRMDAGVGRILDELGNQGLRDNSIVLFSSDNGPDLGSYGGRSQLRFNSGYRDGKYSVHEGGIRVPMIVRWPMGLQGGRHCHDMVHMLDWFPTLLVAAGIPLPGDLQIDGGNILPALRGEKGEVNTRRFWQWTRYRPAITSNAAMRDEEWKLVRPIIPEGHRMLPEDGAMARKVLGNPDIPSNVVVTPLPEIDLSQARPPELYNIDEDPLEHNDLALKYPERVAGMLRELEEWFHTVISLRRDSQSTNESDRQSIQEG